MPSSYSNCSSLAAAIFSKDFSHRTFTQCFAPPAGKMAATLRFSENPVFHFYFKYFVNRCHCTLRALSHDLRFDFVKDLHLIGFVLWVSQSFSAEKEASTSSRLGFLARSVGHFESLPIEMDSLCFEITVTAASFS